MVTCFVVGIAWFIGNSIPLLGFIIGLVINGPLLGGVWSFFIKKARGEEAGIAVGFSGFGPQFVQLMLGTIVIVVLTLLCVVPGCAGIIAGLVIGGAAQSKAAVGVLAGGGALLLLVGAVFAIYLSVSWYYAMPLIADKRMAFWPAMSLSKKVVGKHWWSNFGLGFVGGFIMVVPLMVLAGVVLIPALKSINGGNAPDDFMKILIPILIFAGGMMVWVVLTAPFIFCSFAARYLDMFNDLAEREE
jgi:hypothetical protein